MPSPSFSPSKRGLFGGAIMRADADGISTSNKEGIIWELLQRSVKYSSFISSLSGCHRLLDKSKGGRIKATSVPFDAGAAGGLVQRHFSFRSLPGLLQRNRRRIRTQRDPHSPKPPSVRVRVVVRTLFVRCSYACRTLFVRARTHPRTTRRARLQYSHQS